MRVTEETAITVEAPANVEERRPWNGCTDVLEAAPDSIVIVDGDGGISFANVQTERMFGYTRGELLGRPLGTLLPERFREKHARYCSSYVTHPRVRPMGIGLELYGRRKDGSEFPVDISLSPLRAGQGSCVMAIIRDVSLRKRTEQALRDARRRTEAALQRERRIAARFQGALLPRGRVYIAGYEVAHAYRPALAEADVGGDFYNVFRISDRSVGIVIGDVGGKGLEAAAEAARVQHTVMALAINLRHSPGAVLDGAGRVVRAFEDPDRIVTILFGILDRDTGRLRYAGAGHEPAMVWRGSEQRVSLLMPTGTAILGMPTGMYSSRETALEPGDLLFLYTDGLPDARRSHEFLGWDRVRDLLAAEHRSDPPAILDAMYRAAMEHSAGDLSDDIAMVVIRRLAPVDPISRPRPGSFGRSHRTQ